jgi:hypothetical protein
MMAREEPGFGDWARIMEESAEAVMRGRVAIVVVMFCCISLAFSTRAYRAENLGGFYRENLDVSRDFSLQMKLTKVTLSLRIHMRLLFVKLILRDELIDRSIYW